MPEQEVDLKQFKRPQAAVLTGAGFGRFTIQAELHAIAQLGYGLDPRTVPVSALQLQLTNPAVYLAMRTISGIIRRPDLWSVRHDDPKIVAGVEAWLWPLLPLLSAAAARAFAYGTVAVVLDWERRTLRIMVPSGNGKKRAKTLQRHTHFARAFEIHPDETTLQLDAQGEVVAVQTLGGTYPTSRAHVWVWDGEFGQVVGQAALRRSWRPYCEHIIVSLLRDKYLERSVDAPRVSYSPDGQVVIDGVTWRIPDYVGHLLDQMRGSGSINLPSARYGTDGAGERKYDVDVLDVPDRAEVWDQALNRCEAEMFLAFLVSSTLSGGLDDTGGAASRTLEGMLREHVEDLATFAASGLSRIVGLVHRANYDPDDVAPPEIVATDVGKAAARKIFQEVLRLGNTAARGEIAMRTDVPALLDKLGVPLREAPFDPFAGPDPSGAEPGAPRDPQGGREERREDSRTEEGEDDTGGDDVEREERD